MPGVVGTISRVSLASLSLLARMVIIIATITIPCKEARFLLEMSNGEAVRKEDQELRREMNANPQGDLADEFNLGSSMQIVELPLFLLVFLY